jgi:glutamate dehydrogenase/leucine dehydrogenase
LGVFYGIREFLRYPEVRAKTGLTEGIRGKTVSIQGFGKVVLSRVELQFFLRVGLCYFLV